MLAIDEEHRIPPALWRSCVTSSPPENRPLDFASLAGRRIALWGWGREGRAAYHALRSRLPRQALTLFCSEAEAVDAAAFGDASLSIEHDASGERLAAFDMVVKSPGISPNKPEALLATQRGARFIGGTALWFGEHAGDGTMARTLCVTGTKGKSTTSSLLAHLLRAAGLRTALAGNIGLPLLELVKSNRRRMGGGAVQLPDPATSRCPLRPAIAIVTNLFPEHLDWHGSEARYLDDKLALVTEAKPHVAVLNAADPRLATAVAGRRDPLVWRRARLAPARGRALSRRRLRDGHVRIAAAGPPQPQQPVRGADRAGSIRDGREQAGRACGYVQPLPNRLQPIGERDGILYVNDSISTAPHATLAALDLYRGRPLAVLVGGHDRGLPWDEFAEAMRAGTARDRDDGPERPAHPCPARADRDGIRLRAAGRARPRRCDGQGACGVPGRRGAAVAGCAQLRRVQGLRGPWPAFPPSSPASIRRRFPVSPEWASPSFGPSVHAS